MSSKKAFPSNLYLPIHLSLHEIERPHTVLEQYFDIFGQLPATRIVLDDWLHDALSKNTIESKLHIETHKWVCKLVEACWQIMKHNTVLNVPESQPVVTTLEDEEENVEIHIELNDNEEEEVEDVVLGKPSQVGEKATSDPLYTIHLIFKRTSSHSINEMIYKWKTVSLSAQSSVYDDGDQRYQLEQFHEQLLVFVEAMSVVYIQNIMDKGLKKVAEKVNKTILLTQKQKENPKDVITAFFERFPIKYIKRELNDMFDAGMVFSGEWPNNFCEVDLIEIYRIVLYLIESAECLTTSGDLFLW